MYFFTIYDMIREFHLMCMMQKRERRISMDGGLWPDRNNACKTSVLSPRSPPPTPPLPALYIAVLSTMPHYRWNTPHSYVFSMKVTGVHESSLDRQVTERVNIENFQGPILMNRRNELGGVRIERMQYRRWGGQ